MYSTETTRDVSLYNYETMFDILWEYSWNKSLDVLERVLIYPFEVFISSLKYKIQFSLNAYSNYKVSLLMPWKYLNK